MPRKPTYDQLLEKIARLEKEAVVGYWMLREAKAFPADSFVVLTSPQGFATYLVQTDEHGAPGVIWSEMTNLQAGEILRACGDNATRYAAAARGIDALRKAGAVRTPGVDAPE